MTATGLVRETPFLLEPLRGLESRLADIGRAELGSILAPVVERLHEPLEPGELHGVAMAALSFCKRLYTNARSGEALILARAVLFQAKLASDPLLERLASTVCGLLAADTARRRRGDGALRKCPSPGRRRSGGSERNLEQPGPCDGHRGKLRHGGALLPAGNRPLEGRTPIRCIPRYVAWMNLAKSHFELELIVEGLAVAARRAHVGATEEFRERDLTGALSLRREPRSSSRRVGARSPRPSHTFARLSAMADRDSNPARPDRGCYRSCGLRGRRSGRADIALTRLEGSTSPCARDARLASRHARVRR